jgi:hypothetical protein
MGMIRRKDYGQQTDDLDNVIDFVPTADTGWRFLVDDRAYDLRRWLFVGRPLLDLSSDSADRTVSADREQFVVSVRDAIWRLKAKGATSATLNNYVAAGMATWFRFHDMLFEKGRNLNSTKHINRHVVEQYISWLRKSPGKRSGRTLSYTSAKAIYGFTKSVFKEVARAGEAKLAIFPLNPFPGAERAYVGATPLDQAELKCVMAALGHDLAAIRSGDNALISIDVAAVYFLLVAARTGRNLTPLLEMTLDSIEAHPLRETMGVLKLYKRRGSKIHRQGFATQSVDNQTGNAPTDVIAIVKEYIERTDILRQGNPALVDRTWVYQTIQKKEICALDARALYSGVDRFCARHGFEDSKRARTISVSRFRKTFAMHMWHLSRGDLARTAELMGNRPTVTDTHYLSVTPEMQRNHKFVGRILAATIEGEESSPGFISNMATQLGLPEEKTIEIISGRSNTGVARCSDYLNGRFAPRNGNDVCTRFLHCFRCPNQVVMESDLYRLFSFYWLLLKERTLLGKNRWKAVYSWVIRVIDREIAPRFDPGTVARARDRARDDPHPMWRDRALLAGTEVA